MNLSVAAKSDSPSEPAPTTRKLFLLRKETATALGVTPYKILALEKDGELHPRRDGRGRRCYRASEVAAVGVRLAAQKSAPTGGNVDAAILELAAEGKTDAEITCALRVPLAVVHRIRAAGMLGHASDEDEAEARRFLADAERELDEQRMRQRAELEARRKDRR